MSRGRGKKTRVVTNVWGALKTSTRWPTAVIGVTVAAFGTSFTELLVAIHSALDGVPEISLGDVLGSNVANVALVLAIVLVLSGMRTEDSGVRRDWFFSLLVPGVVYALLFDGWFSRLDAAIMMTCFFCLAHHRHPPSAQACGITDGAGGVRFFAQNDLRFAGRTRAADWLGAVCGAWGQRRGHSTGLESLHRRRGRGGRSHQRAGTGDDAHRPHARSSSVGKGVPLEQVNQRDEAFGYANLMDEKYDFVRTLRKGGFHSMRSFEPWLPDRLNYINGIPYPKEEGRKKRGKGKKRKLGVIVLDNHKGRCGFLLKLHVCHPCGFFAAVVAFQGVRVPNLAVLRKTM